MTRTDELRGAHTPRSAREVLVAHVGADPYQGVEQLKEVGEAKAQAEGVAYELENGRKIVLARLMNEIASSRPDEKFSEAKLERLARADPRYAEHVKRTAQAVEGREKANSDYWAIRSELEWDRAAIAHLNALSKLDEGVGG